MNTNLKSLVRAVACVTAFDGLLLVLLWLIKDTVPSNDLVANLRLLFILFVLLVNSPGFGLARGAGLLANNGPFEHLPDPHPVAGKVVAFVFSVVVWSAVVWSIGAFARKLCQRAGASSGTSAGRSAG